MAKSDAVTAVTGEIFREGWSRVRGSTQGLGEKRKQMTRAAKGHRAAVFKAIRSGGTHTKGQLSNQLEYLTSKSTHIVDSRGVLDGKKQLNADEIKSVVERFSSRWDEGFRPKMGHTTHMLMSFPVGTRGADVRDIASAVAERFFANDERNFDYLIAVHEDRAHPHAHVVLNRRSQEGEYFYLGRDHHFNYDDFRIAMVEEAEKVGVRLEATRRIDRGVLTYAPRTKEVYAAKEEGREPVARERVGRDLDRALAEIATTSSIYRSLAAEASAENREDISNALTLASELLGQGGQLDQNGDVYMATQESFDDLRSRFADRAERVEQFVRDAPDAMKAKYEKQLDAIYRNVAHMQPVGVRSATLNDAASDTGVYSETNINKDAVSAMKEPETRAQIETALRGTGISSAAVIARVEQGASNAWLEQRWMADDLSKIAKTDGLNLERKEDLEAAAAKLDQVHVQLGQTLERAEVLHDDGVVEDIESTERVSAHIDQSSVDRMSNRIRDELMTERAETEDFDTRFDRVQGMVERGEIEALARDRIASEQQDYLRDRPEIVGSPAMLYSDEPFRERIVDQSLADRISGEVDQIMERADARDDVAEAVAKDMKERYPDMPDHLARGLGQTYATSTSLNDQEAIQEAQREAAAEADYREDVADRIRTEAGVERAEREGIAREDRGTVADIERGVRDQFDDRANEYTRFEPLVVERNRIDASDNRVVDGAAMAVAFRDLANDRHNGQLSVEDQRRTDALLRDTAERYGPAMRDGLRRDGFSDREVREFELTMRDYRGAGVQNEEIARVIEHERHDKINSAFPDDRSREIYRGEIERELSDERIEELRNGDSEALSEVIDNRLDRLYAAKAYLQSDEATANSEATREVISEIAEEEYDAQRLKHVHANSEKGQTHG
ncbi:relaxase/mobilization nuclease domain-containing protein [Ruegeria sp. YS9]|uniref:relaxase/mobilization nuclease domain-containing protein n=1 Tax=Ruegeria sp. YS9 TaxID=2966453 RepID=UPI00214CA3B5|nr:relaxase/mobilization nuclease domain-containing protein [Ruegeria sp. YS9]UUV08704.1 relaxase/mobilization nuclease domain-containing protein [Ruegeria sp. YS9]